MENNRENTHVAIVADNVKSYLKINNKTVYRLSQETGIHTSCIYDLLNGKTKDMKLSTLWIYAKALNITSSELLQMHYYKKDG